MRGPVGLSAHDHLSGAALGCIFPSTLAARTRMADCNISCEGRAMRPRFLPLLFLGLLHSQGSPATDYLAAEACAANLEPGAKSVYDAALPLIGPRTTLRAVLRHILVREVMSGEVSRNTAQEWAENASHCLDLVP